MKAFACQDPHAGKAGPVEGQTSPQLAAQVGSYKLGSCPADPHGGMGKVCDLSIRGAFGGYELQSRFSLFLSSLHSFTCLLNLYPYRIEPDGEPWKNEEERDIIPALW